MRKSARDLITSLIVVIVLGALVGVFAWGTNGFKNWEAATWFNNWGKGSTTVEPEPEPEQPDPEDYSDVLNRKDKEGAVVNMLKNKGIKLASAKIAAASYEESGVGAQTDTAYTITASIEPAETTNKEVDWTVAWTNAESTWATDKTVTDYVTVTPETDGALTAIVECKQAFGEQVILTCKSRSNTALVANCSVDYVKRIEQVRAVVTRVSDSDGSVVSNAYSPFNGSAGFVLDNGRDYKHHAIVSSNGFYTFNDDHSGLLVYSLTYTIDFTPIYTTGTLYGNYTYTAEFGSTGANSSFCTGKKVTKTLTKMTRTYRMVIDINDDFISTLYGAGASTSSTHYDYWGASALTETGAMIIQFRAVDEYNNAFYFYYYTALYQKSFTVYATDVSLDNSAIIF